MTLDLETFVTRLEKRIYRPFLSPTKMPLQRGTMLAQARWTSKEEAKALSSPYHLPAVCGWAWPRTWWLRVGLKASLTYTADNTVVFLTGGDCWGILCRTPIYVRTRVQIQLGSFPSPTQSPSPTSLPVSSSLSHYYIKALNAKRKRRSYQDLVNYVRFSM